MGDGADDVREKGPLRVGFLLLDGFALMSYATASEPLRAANILTGRRLFDVRDVGVAGGRAEASSGAFVPATAQVGEDVDFDLVLVVAGGPPLPERDLRVERWLKWLARRGVRLGGVSGGPVVLARAGLLDRHRLTLHWEHAAALAEERPELAIERSLFVIDRDRVTCAGGTAPLDLMHNLIAERHGPTLAARVSEWFVHGGPRAGEGPQREGTLGGRTIRHPALLAAVSAMEASLAQATGEPLDTAALAGRTGVGPRQLSRLFRTHLGRTPMRVYRDMRLERARALLGQTGMSVGEVAVATGFTSFAHFSAAFREATGASPREWRRGRKGT